MARDDDRNYVARCSFCGKSESMVHKLIEGPGVFICDECINLCNDLIEHSVPSARASAVKREDDTVLPKPEEIKKKLDEYVIGQDDAKIALSVAVYNHSCTDPCQDSECAFCHCRCNHAYRSRICG